jgi:hypothetical protein
MRFSEMMPADWSSNYAAKLGRHDFPFKIWQRHAIRVARSLKLQADLSDSCPILERCVRFRTGLVHGLPEHLHGMQDDLRDRIGSPKVIF